MNNKINDICRTIAIIVGMLLWTHALIALVMLGPPIWPMLLIIGTVICVCVYLNKMKRSKKLTKKLEELENRIKELEKDR